MKYFFKKAIGNSLIKFRYVNKRDPFIELKNILVTKPDRKDHINDESILIAPIRMSPTSNLFEILLGLFCEYNGKNVKFLLCNQFLNYCENKTSNRRSSLNCLMCLAEQYRITKYFNIDVVLLNDLITKEELDAILSKTNKFAFNNDSDYIFEGINLKNCIESGVMRYTLKSDLKGVDENIIKQFALTSFILKKASDNLLIRYKISHLIISHGIYSTWGTVVEVFKKYDIPTLVWGRGYVGDGQLLFGHNMGYHEEFINEIPIIKDLTIQQYYDVQSYFKNKSNASINVDFVNYYNGMKFSNFNITKFYKELKNYNVIYGMFTNIPWDGQVFNKTDAFPSTRLFIKNTLDWFEGNKDCLLIIRAHPAEKTRKAAKGTERILDIIMELYPDGLNENIIFLSPDNPITSYKLIELIDCAILYGSTLCLEFAVKNKLVIQTGKFNLSNKKIIFECNSLEDFYKYLEKVKNKELFVTEEMYKNAIKYGYYWIFKRHLPDTTMELRNLYFDGYKFKTFNDFMNNKLLNKIFNQWIIRGEKLLNE